MHRRLFGALCLIGTVAVCACQIAGIGSGRGIGQTYSRTQEASFSVEESPTLTIDNFGGDVTVTSGSAGTIQVTALERAAAEEDLDKIEVEMNERTNGVEIVTRAPAGLNNTSVDLEIAAPNGTYVVLSTGSGNISVAGLGQKAEADTGGGDISIKGAEGEVTVQTGGGDVSISSANGTVSARTGGGNIDYQGTPVGTCTLSTGGGNIQIQVPSEMGLSLSLDTGGGQVTVGPEVKGDVSKTRVDGTIGSGEEATIEAQTGGGDIDLTTK
jgi:hypothetical protein